MERSLWKDSMENLKIRSLKFWCPRQSRSQWSLGLQTEELSESLSTERWEGEPRYSPCTSILSHSGAFYTSCSQLHKGLENSLEKPKSPGDIYIWENLNKMASWTIRNPM